MRKPLTTRQQELLRGDAGHSREKLEAYARNLWAAGYDVPGFTEGTGPAPRPTKPAPTCRRQISTIGDRVKAKTQWTGIAPCQRCAEVARKLNALTPAEVRERLDEFAKAMLTNILLLSNGDAAELTWWQRQDARLKTKAALLVKGEAGVLDYCRAYISEACEEEESALVQTIDHLQELPLVPGAIRHISAGSARAELGPSKLADQGGDKEDDDKGTFEHWDRGPLPH